MKGARHIECFRHFVRDLQGDEEKLRGYPCRQMTRTVGVAIPLPAPVATAPKRLPQQAVPQLPVRLGNYVYNETVSSLSPSTNLKLQYQQLNCYL